MRDASLLLSMVAVQADRDYFKTAQPSMVRRRDTRPLINKLPQCVG